jgi:hypothetical protein
MDKLLGILPYIYFFDEPVQIGPVKFIGVPDWQGRNHAPSESSDREYLQELMKCFPVSRGLQSNKGAIRALTYFLLDDKDKSDNQANNEARKATTLLRYMMLRPDLQALDNIETSTIYTFELPPAGKEEYRIYRCWVNFNQEEWITPAHQKFHPPGWYVDFKMMSSNDLEGLDEIKKQFYEGYLNSKLEADILLAMEWYNLSFAKYYFHDIAGRLLYISVAFDTLFRLLENKVTLYDCINYTLNSEAGSPLERWSRDFYGKVRSATMHFGKPATLLYTHPEAREGHLSFLWSAQRIFRECVAVKSEIKRNVSNEHLIEELTPNEVLLKELRELGSYEKIKNAGALLKVWKLRLVYPVGERDDIVWLGKILLGEMAKQPVTKKLENLSAVIESILNTKDNDEMLGWQYHKLVEQLKGIFNQDADKGLKDLVKSFNLVYLIRYFAEFAGYALVILYYSQKQKSASSKKLAP